MEFRLELTTTNLLIAVNVIMYIATAVLASLTGQRLEVLSILGADAYYYQSIGQLWRLVTSSFLHANEIHLLVNMYALYSLGNVIERTFDGRKLFVLYIFTAIGGALLSNIVEFLSIQIGLSDPNVISLSVGASGALFGIVGFLLASPFINVDRTRLYYLLFLNFAIGIAFAGLINNWAHLGGVVAGYAFGYFESKIRFLRNDEVLYRVALGITGLSYIALIFYNTF